MADNLEQGLPEQTEQAPDKSNDPIEFDPKKTYKFRGKMIRGNEIESKYFRGEGYQQLQSERDRIKQELAQKESDLDILRDEINKIRRETEMKNYFDKSLSSINKPVNDGFNNDYNADPDQEAPSSDKLAQIVAQLKNEIQNDVTSTVTSSASDQIKQILTDILQEQNQEKRAREYIDDFDNTDRHYVMSNFPNFAKTDQAKDLIDQYVTLRRQIRTLNLEIPSLYSQRGGPDPAWREKQEEAQQIDFDTAKLLSKIDQLEQQARELSDARQIIGSGVRPLTEELTEDIPSNPVERDKWWKKKREDGLKRYNAKMKAMGNL